MKTILSILLSFFLLQAGAQGRVVINEYMPWPNNNCGTTSEFVELLNFGPGPVNIGCYIITEGDYAITIPANTILQPGQFYVIAGQASLAKGCGNIDSAVTVHLNWNACSNCVSAPIPQTGDGLFTDGGAASEQVVLLDPNLKVVDAVVRDISLKEPSSTITTVASGSCGAKTFNLDNMGIQYEQIGSSAGNGNSFARTVDGDCQWVKDTRQSANASNTQSGETSSITYTLTITSSQDCGNTKGAIAITPNTTSVFPLNYTLAYDANGDNVFGTSDTYTYGVDSTAPNLEVSGLQAGNYRISVGSSLGCNLKTFDFSILSCNSVLAVQLQQFRHVGTTETQHRFSLRVADASQLKEAILEQSTDGRTFYPAASLRPATYTPMNQEFFFTINRVNYRFFRLRLIPTEGAVQYSPTISLGTGVVINNAKLWPNPATSVVNLSLPYPITSPLSYLVVNSNGLTIQKGLLQTESGSGLVQLPVSRLQSGIYQVVLFPQGKQQPISMRFVKR